MNGYLDNPLPRSGALAGFATGGRTLLANAGTVVKNFEQELFDKIIVSPHVINAGFVLSVLTFDVTVWNTFYDRSHVLNSVDIVGAAGVSITAPAPSNFAATAYAVYSVIVDQTGAVDVDDTITFNYADIPGASVIITGSRLVVFSPMPDWGSGFKKKRSFSTNVLESYDGHEQRVQLRAVPEDELSFTVSTVEPEDRSLVDSLLWGWGSRTYGVPFWPDATPLSATAVAGNPAIYFDTTNLHLAVDGLLLLWADALTWEAFSIVEIASTHVIVANAPKANWPASSTIVLPMIQASLADQTTHTGETAGMGSASLTFTSEIVS